MGKVKKPPKWTDVYPQGTKEGDEEQVFFIALARHPKWEWRSVPQLSKEAGLTEKRVEELINKYYKKGMIFQNPKNEIYWGYWERVPEYLPKDNGSITGKDQKHRINLALKGSGANSKVDKQLSLFHEPKVSSSRVAYGKIVERQVQKLLEHAGYKMLDAKCEGR